MSQSSHVALIHAYSSKNSGDGLLVDLSVALLKHALGESTRVSLVAADPASFPHHSDVYPAPVLAERGMGRLSGAAAFALPLAMRGRTRCLMNLLDSVDLIAGVGGGYLRARNCIEALKLEAGHLVQMRAAVLSGKPTVYLPQSIGPTMPAQPLCGHLSSMLGKFSRVFVRDDRSAALLAGNANTLRAPDLAVIDFERRSEAILARVSAARTEVAHVAFVLRRAPSWSAQQRARYEASTRELVKRVRETCRVSFAVQSQGRGNDDLAYYRSIGIDGDLVSLKQLLSQDRPDVVVSVRLHGALESILHGVPAYHLSYERKGFGAYADLGVNDWVSNAADFDAGSVAETLFEADSIRKFWTCTSAGFDRIRASREQVIQSLRVARDAG
jgi:polysaccharide pyruvyl transferase WcaK-like protein